jgi:tetratricopeptide (TPR) repeat protein
MRRWLNLVLLLVLVLVHPLAAPASLGTQDDPAQRDSARLFIDAALTLASQGDTSAALAQLKQAIELAPDLAEAHFQFGRLLALHAWPDTLSPQHHEARAALLKAVALDPDNELYLFTLVRVRGERQMTDEGRRVVDELLRPERATTLLDPDSMLLVDTARVWQREFEVFRRRNLQRGRVPVQCDERLGPTCLAYVDNVRFPVREPAVVDSARRALLAKLAAASESLPGDEWIKSQRVRYLVEAGRLDQALALARSCGLTTRWWCDALVGYVFHLQEDFHGADSAFTAALQAMPVDGRRWWTDIAIFLDGDLRRDYESSFGTLRDSLERRFWWLADPLYLTSFNDRRTEHMARNVIGWLQHQAPSGYGLGDPETRRQIVLRHGWPLGWIVSGQGQNRSRISAVYAGHRRQLLPRSGFVLDPSSIQPGEWSVARYHEREVEESPGGERDEPRSAAPFETYAPTYVSSFTTLEHQLAVFPRGDSAAVVAGYDQCADPAWLEAPVKVGLFLAQDELTGPVVLEPAGDEPRGVLSTTVGAEPMLMSLEMFSEQDRRAARVRYGVRPRRLERFQFAVSDLLITSGDSPLPGSLAAAIPRTRGSLRVRAGEKLGLYWEVYGLGPDAETVSVHVALHKVGAGQLGRLQEVELAENPPLSLGWDEVVPAYTRIWPRSLVVDLPNDLSPGIYAFYLEVGARTREPVRSVRALLVEAR